MRRLQNLPAAPKVLLTLKRLMANPDSSLDQIAEVIALEPGLSARVVKMANSVHFGRGGPVENILEAIQRVGEKGVQELVTFAVASQLVGQPLAAYGLTAQQLWSRAVACAIAAASIAERNNLPRDDAYTAGLMHGIGLLVLDRHASTQRRPQVFTSAGYPQDFAPDEQAWLDFSHAEAGAALLDLWGFSPSVTAAVRFQLAPEDAGEHRQLTMILATARWARSLFCVPEELIPDLPSMVWLEETAMPLDDFGEWLSQVRIRYTIACEELRLG